MGQERFEQHKELMKFHNRGRNRTATDEVRANGYRNEDGRYVMSDGLKPWHERIVDWLLINPHAKVVDVAREFKVTPQWAGQVMRTDAFQEYYSVRMRGYRERYEEQLVYKLQSVANKSLDRLAEKVEVADLEGARQVADTTLKALGYTSNVNLVATQTNNVYTVPKERYERARERMLEAQKNKELPAHDQAAYRHVTSSLEREIEGVEDAVVLPNDED